jgi:hypothetical protein
LGTPNSTIAKIYFCPDIEFEYGYKVEVVGSSPGTSAAKMKAEIAKWGKVIKDAGIKVD